MPSFALPALPDAARLEVLQVDAAPLVRHFLNRLGLPGLFDRHLAHSPGRKPDLPSATILGALVSNLLLSRQPLYALSSWASAFVPEHLGLRPGQAALLNDDRGGRAVDHLFRSDRASLLTAIVLGRSRASGLGWPSSTRTPRPSRSRVNTPTNLLPATPSARRGSRAVTTRITV